VQPRKFYYEETHYFGRSYLIEWDPMIGLGLQDSSSCIPFIVEPSLVLNPSDSDWKSFETSIEALALEPREPESTVCDGFDVQCHITFRTRLLKFSIVNPDFEGFNEFRDLLNQFTVCSDYPNGLLETAR
jgi:hypothetical protein